jgi:two-component system sensor histidine kinase/response regulator
MAVAAIALTVMAGWVLQVRALVEVVPGATPMKFNTTVGLLLAAIGLPGVARRSRVTRVVGVLLLLLGAVTVGEYAGLWTLGVGEILVRDWIATDAPGRMSLNTAVCLGLTGFAYLHATVFGGRLGLVTLPPAIALLSISLSAFVGYVTGIEAVYRWGGTTRMSLLGALTFLLLGTGLLAAGWNHVYRRRQTWLAAGIAACVAGITVLVWLGVRSEQERSLRLESRTAAEAAAQIAATALVELTSALIRLDERWSGACDEPCRNDVRSYLRDYPELTTVGWTVEPERPGGIYERAGADIAPVTPATAARLAQIGEGAALSPTGATQTGSALAGSQLVLAIRRPPATRVLLAGVDPLQLMQHVLDPASRTGSVGLTIDGRLLLPLAPAVVNGSPGRVGAFSTTILGLEWQFHAAAETRAPFSPFWLLLGGLLITGFVGATAHLWQASRAHVREIRTLNVQLEARVAERTRELAATNADLELAIAHESDALAMLRETERQLRELADAMPQIVWTAQPDGTFGYYNRRWYEYTGLSTEQTESWGWQTALHPDDREKALARWTRSFRSGEPYEVEYRFRRASDGAYRWHLGRAVPVRDAHGTIVRWFGTFTEIEDYKRAQAEILALNETLEARVQKRTTELASANRDLRDARAGLQSVLDAATQISIIATDAQGIIRVFNAGAERMLQYRADEMIGLRTPAILHDPAERDARARLLAEERGRPVTDFELFVASASEGEVHEREWTYVRKDGTRLRVNLVMTAVYDAERHITGYLGIATDITTRKRLEADLRQEHDKLEEQTRRAEDANRAKSEFLAAMSHEIRTPMNAILGMADLLWESSLDHEQRHYVDVFRRAGNNLLALINDILDLSKIEAGRFELEKVPFDLADVVGQIADLIKARARGKGLALAIHREPDVPVALVGDPLRLRQVLVNLLGNAVKFTERGAVTLTIERQPEGGPGAIVFSVRDTGIGIPEDQRERIFEEFTQADASTTRTFGGTGLGLGISRHLVELMGGQLTVTSTVGLGSTFTFDAHFDIAPAPVASSEVTDLHGHRVLVIDDDATNRLVLREALSAWGIQSRDFDSPAAGLDDLARAHGEDRPYSLVIVDNQMPEMDGFEAARRVRQVAPDLPVVMLASDTERGDESRRIEAGVAGFAMKPINRPELLRVLCDAMKVSLVAGSVDEVDAGTSGAEPLAILVAEDLADNRVLVQAYLKGTGHSVVFAEDGHRAVDLFTHNRFDLVLMDIQMPGMDGLEATRTIRRLEQRRGWTPPPIVALTANARPSDIQDSRDAGCSSHLIKPISKRGLLSAIREVMAETAQGHDEASSTSVDVPEELEEFAAAYLDSRRRDVEELQQLAQNGDFDRIRISGHNMAGSGRSYGFAALSDIGKALEDAARDFDPVEIRRQIDALRDYLSRVRIATRP